MWKHLFPYPFVFSLPSPSPCLPFYCLSSPFFPPISYPAFPSSSLPCLSSLYQEAVPLDPALLPVVSGSALHVAIISPCHDTVASSSVVGRFLLQAWQPGTRCQTMTNSVIRRSALKTLVCVVLQHALRNALYKCSAYLLTYLLTATGLGNAVNCTAGITKNYVRNTTI